MSDTTTMHDLDAARILGGLVGTRFQHIEVYPSLPSTQTLLVEEGGRDGRVVVADHQTAGRGRAGRTWLSSPGRSLACSVLLRDIPGDRAPLVSLAAGLAVAVAVEQSAGVEPRLKWPNDVLLDGRKLSGILGELVSGGEYLVVGIGVNVAYASEELPAELGAASLRVVSGATVSRGELLVGVLSTLDRLLAKDDWLGEYRRRSSTIGSRVRVELTGGHIEGEATDIRDDGALIVDGQPIVAGDVVHVRPPA